MELKVTGSNPTRSSFWRSSLRRSSLWRSSLGISSLWRSSPWRSALRRSSLRRSSPQRSSPRRWPVSRGHLPPPPPQRLHPGGPPAGGSRLRFRCIRYLNRRRERRIDYAATVLFNRNTAGWGVDAGSVPMIYIIPNVPFSCDPIGSCGRDCLSCCWGPSSPKKDSLNQNKNAQKPTLTKALPTLAHADNGISARQIRSGELSRTYAQTYQGAANVGFRRQRQQREIHSTSRNTTEF